MIIFSVVKDKHGWAVQTGEQMTTPFRSRELAIREATCLADSIRRHGEFAEVVVEGAKHSEAPHRISRSASSLVDAVLRGHGLGPL